MSLLDSFSPNNCKTPILVSSMHRREILATRIVEAILGHPVNKSLIVINDITINKTLFIIDGFITTCVKSLYHHSISPLPRTMNGRSFLPRV